MLCMILRRNMFMRRAPEDEQRKSRSDEERENAALRMARAELLRGSCEFASRNHALHDFAKKYVHEKSAGR